jgi:myosin-3
MCRKFLKIKELKSNTFLLKNILQEQRMYHGQARSDNPPHIFAVADAAYQALLHQCQNQAIVISGESGAGKTESANLLLKQLVFLGKV